MDRIWHFLAERDLDRADRIEATIRAGVEKLLAFSMLGQARPRLGIRERLLSDTQYRVGYEIRDDEILVTPVRSTRERA